MLPTSEPDAGSPFPSSRPDDSHAAHGSRPASSSSGTRTVDAAAATHPGSLASLGALPEVLGRYRILRELGRGGMGAVYLAEDSLLARKVALKVPQFEASQAYEMQTRFLREAQTAAQLSHPNICQVYDVGVIDGQYVMAMEYVDGRTLSDFTKPGKLFTERQAAQLVRKLAMALEVAHQKGMIHRDLKPGNVMIPRPSPARKVTEPKVMDFGLAKSLQNKSADVTKSGMILGTPCYMSKEQWSGKESQLGPACDVYSLGVILYELLTGTLPYDVDPDEPATTWFVKLMSEPQVPVRTRKPDADPALELIVMKAIAIDSTQRYASMVDFLEAIDQWLKLNSLTGKNSGLPSFGADLASASAATKGVERYSRRPSRPNSQMFQALAAATVAIAILSIFIAYYMPYARPSNKTPAAFDVNNLRRPKVALENQPQKLRNTKEKSIESKGGPEPKPVASEFNSTPPLDAIPKPDAVPSIAERQPQGADSGENTKSQVDERDSPDAVTSLDDLAKINSLSVFQPGDVYVGVWKRFEQGSTIPAAASRITVTVMSRNKNRFEAQWYLDTYSDTWRIRGEVKMSPDGTIRIYSVDLRLVKGPHPNDGNVSLDAHFNPDGKILRGTNSYKNGGHSEFIVEAINDKKAR